MADGKPNGGAARATRPKTTSPPKCWSAFRATPDPRLRQIMLSLIAHLHAFVKEVELTEAEWFQAIEILTEAGQMCSDKRQEFILFSDTLGSRWWSTCIDHRKPDGATEFDRVRAVPPARRARKCRPAATSPIATRPARRPWSAAGCSTSTASRSPARVLDVWQAQTNGLYDSQDRSLDELHMRGKFRTDAEGRYLMRTVLPVNYPIPSDGPVGAMLKATGRHPWRPAHIHFVVSADGYEPVTTHIFDRTDPYLGSDAVFAVKESLICDFVAARDARRRGDAGSASPGRSARAEFDFRLTPATGAAGHDHGRAAPPRRPRRRRVNIRAGSFEIESSFPRKRESRATASSLALDPRFRGGDGSGVPCLRANPSSELN